jgi:hypothetical protein
MVTHDDEVRHRLRRPHVPNRGLLEANRLANEQLYFPPPRPEELSGIMARAASRIPIPSRFQTKREGPRVTIRDTKTGREVTVGLCDYRGARKVLHTLFGEED